MVNAAFIKTLLYSLFVYLFVYSIHGVTTKKTVNYTMYYIKICTHNHKYNFQVKALQMLSDECWVNDEDIHLSL